jgi:hypothetical protein
MCIRQLGSSALSRSGVSPKSGPVAVGSAEGAAEEVLQELLAEISGW